MWNRPRALGGLPISSEGGDSMLEFQEKSFSALTILFRAKSFRFGALLGSALGTGHATLFAACGGLLKKWGCS